jgi:hypothetical protein
MIIRRKPAQDKPIISKVFVDTHKIWHESHVTVSKDLSPRLMKILRGGIHNGK